MLFPFYFVIFTEFNWCKNTCLVSQDKKRQTSLGQIGLPQSGNLPGSLFAEFGDACFMPRSRKELFSVSHSLLYTSEPDRESTFHLDLVYMFFFYSNAFNTIWSFVKHMPKTPD